MRNKATINILKSNFHAHIEKAISILRNLSKEQEMMRKEANKLLKGYNEVRKNLVRLSEGLWQHFAATALFAHWMGT